MSRKKKEEYTEEEYEEEEEIRIKKIRILGGIAGAIVAAAFYLGIPYFMNNYFIPNWTEYIKIDVELDIKWDNLVLMFDRWFFAGIPMVVLGMLTWACPKGSRQRLFMSTVYLIGSIVWLLYVLNFGDLADLINVTINGNTFEFGIVLTFMLYLLVLFRALKFLIIYGMYKDSRKDYLDGE